LPEGSLSGGETEQFVRNQMGQAMNQMNASLPEGCAVALERPNIRDMRFQSRQMNRWLGAGQLGYLPDRLRAKLDNQGIRYRSVQAAYSSQPCSHCGYLERANRPDQ
jgi:transposase